MPNVIEAIRETPQRVVATHTATGTEVSSTIRGEVMKLSADPTLAKLTVIPNANAKELELLNHLDAQLL